MADIVDDVTATHLNNVISIVFNASAGLQGDDDVRNASDVTQEAHIRSTDNGWYDPLSVAATLAIPIPLILLSLLGNTRALQLLLRPPFNKTPHTFYLAALAAVNVVYSAFQSIAVVESFHVNLTAHPFTCQLSTLCRDATNFLEAWLPVCFAVDRMVVARRSGLSSGVGRKAHSVVGTLLLMAIVVYFNKSPLMAQSYLSDGRVVCQAVLYRSYFLLANTCLNNLLPSLLIALLVTCTCCTRDVPSSKQERRMTYALLVTYIVCHLPAGLCRLAYLTLPKDMLWVNFWYVLALTQQLPHVSVASHGFLIAATNPHFRSTFLAPRHRRSQPAPARSRNELSKQTSGRRANANSDELTPLNSEHLA